MTRKFLLPVLAIALLGGCVTDYAYRNGGGGYYYGRPSVEYRHYGGYGYSPYGAYPYGYYSDHPYRYRYPYYSRYPYYPYPYRRHHSHRPSHGDTSGDHDRNKAPWRDLDRIERSKRPRIGPGPWVRRAEPSQVQQPRQARPSRAITTRPQSSRQQQARQQRAIRRAISAPKPAKRSQNPRLREDEP